nr:MAG TPA: Rifin [Caudoviricetes sp.]
MSCCAILGSILGIIVVSGILLFYYLINSIKL